MFGESTQEKKGTPKLAKNLQRAILSNHTPRFDGTASILLFLRIPTYPPERKNPTTIPPQKKKMIQDFFKHTICWKWGFPGYLPGIPTSKCSEISIKGDERFSVASIQGWCMVVFFLWCLASKIELSKLWNNGNDGNNLLMNSWKLVKN